MSAEAVAAEQARFMMRVYNWMASGLTLTAVVAYTISNDPALLQMIFGNTIVLIGLVVAQLGLVVWLSGWVMKMSQMTAMMVFMGYSALTGVTLSSIFVVYTSASITTAFATTALTFGAMSFYGYTTKKDLTSMGSFLMMGLFGIIIASVLNIWLQNPAIYWAITYIGVFIFVGLTAYDTQKIKEMNILGNEGTEEDTKEAILGALTLYLDFINLFIMMLRLMGDRE